MAWVPLKECQVRFRTASSPHQSKLQNHRALRKILQGRCPSPKYPSRKVPPTATRDSNMTLRCYKTTAFQAYRTCCCAGVLISWWPFCLRHIWTCVSLQHCRWGRATSTFSAVVVVPCDHSLRHWNKGLVCEPCAQIANESHITFDGKYCNFHGGGPGKCHDKAQDSKASAKRRWGGYNQFQRWLVRGGSSWSTNGNI